MGAAAKQVDKETHHDVMSLHFCFLLGKFFTLQFQPEIQNCVHVTSMSINQMEWHDGIQNRMRNEHKPSKSYSCLEGFQKLVFFHIQVSRVKLNGIRGKILEVLKVRTI